MQAVRDARFSHESESLKADTARASIHYVAQKFKAAFRPDPRSDLTGVISILIT